MLYFLNVKIKPSHSFELSPEVNLNQNREEAGHKITDILESTSGSLWCISLLKRVM